MKRTINFLRYTALSIFTVLLIVILVTSILSEQKSDEILAETIPQTRAYVEPETVSLSYSEWKEQQTYLDTKASCGQVEKASVYAVSEVSEELTETSEQVNLDKEPDIYSMDVWTLGSYLYGISELDTTRTLKLITIEGYGDSPLSYYVACCCYVRATEGCWGYTENGEPSLFRAFGEVDTNYGNWMDSYEIADYAYEVLRQCYLNPTYVRYCNGMAAPESYVYYENGIYVW